MSSGNTAALPGDTIVEVLVDACHADPDAPALIFEDGPVVSRGELLRLVEDFAAFLRERVPVGSNVAIMLPNRTEFVVAWFATAANQQALVSVNYGMGSHDASHVLRDSGAQLLITDVSRDVLLGEIRDRCPELVDVVIVGPDEPRGLPRCQANGPPPLRDYRPDPRAITNIYYTSGTTGPPKGCMVNHAYWLRFAGLYLDLYGLKTSDRLLCCLQFFYADPPWQMLVSLHAGAPLVCMRRFSVSRFWAVCREFGVTRIFGIGAIPMLLLKAAPREAERDHSVELAVQVGIPSTHHHALEERFGCPWVEAYGLTETGFVTFMPADRPEELVGSGSIGRPCPDVELVIIDDEGAPVQDGETGELLIHAPAMMLGYLGRPEETAAVLEDGWFRSGDLAHRDGDGLYYFHGRKKQMIRRGGENLSPAEIEAVLEGHPAVGQAAVIPVPDELMGEEVMAVLRVADGQEQPTPQELADFCSARLARFKVPRYVCFARKPFPLTASMRVRKEVLRVELDELLADAWDSTEHIDRTEAG
jgi:crotonobetaine/carnitine-CoA ligase